ncbi:cell-division initiation protein [Gracilibacillus halophilus YIM-C55.5]|uniref:Cell division protein DivIB n=1 Tax=Gracilibacillus halophilus YIM-C55.5 TaxID=1308866 RepID=N4WDH2_9BACI|nr:FtsQ-type POTRA domain-containing protein [Gracilibacillus halophilus]ENH98328.1 cell-division initiation protein [Gracilibacillus halophilus YIM-C55.5]
MPEKRVVSIEDRIPKLKRERRKKANRRLIIYLAIFFFLICFVIYLQSPLSHVQKVVVDGNQWVDKQEIVDKSAVTLESNFWGVQSSEVKQAIVEHPLIQSVSVSKQFYHQIRIDIKELKHVGYIEAESKVVPLLENGDQLDAINWEEVNPSVPILSDFSKPIYIQELANELNNLSTYLLSIISEIHWTPTEGNPYQITLYMSDGYEVESSIRNLSALLDTYPSIVSQLDSKQDGVITIDDGGAVFTPYDEVNEDKEEESVE